MSTKITLREIKEKYNFSDSDTWYAALVCRRFSLYFTWFFCRTPITPNQVTFLMILSGIAGGIFLGMPGYISGIIGILFLQLFLILDCVDGEVARSKQIFSSKGKFLDLLANDIAFVSIFTGLGLRAFQNKWAALAAFSAVVFFLLSKLFPFYANGSDKKFTGEYLKPILLNSKMKALGFSVIKNLTYPPIIIAILTIVAILNLYSPFLYFYGLYFIFYYFASLFPRLKNRPEYDKN